LYFWNNLKGDLVAGKMMILALMIGIQTNSFAQQDSADIRKTALNYIEGWYEGNPERMERALHPELAKRIVSTDKQSGKSRLGQMSALTLINGTKSGGGKDTPPEKQQKDVTILDIYRGAASVKVFASDWIDYLHMAKWNGEWRIVNVLWEVKGDGNGKR